MTMPDTPELPPTDLPPLPEPLTFAKLAAAEGPAYSADQMREYILADRATRLAAAPQGWKELLDAVPLPPKAITYEKGWELLDRLQALAVAAPDAAPAASSPEAADERIAELEAEVASVRQWYGSRLDMLSAWARAHLPRDQQETFFNIAANCRPSAFGELSEWAAALASAPAGAGEGASETPAEEALRSLACWLGVGGYNAPTVDAKVFERKIRDGVAMFSQIHGLSPLRQAAEEALAALVELSEHCAKAKDKLNAGIPDGDPVHPVAASLTWPMSTAGLAIDALRAALASAPAGAGEGEQHAPVSPELDATMLWLGETRDSLRAMADRANQLLTAHCRAALAGEPAVAAARPPKMPDEAIREWGDRYDLRMTITEMRSAFEDAQTLHLSEPAVAADEGRPYDALLGYLEAQKFHPSASHVPPDFRDGYNRALQTVIERVQGEQRMAASQDEQQEKP